MIYNIAAAAVYNAPAAIVFCGLVGNGPGDFELALSSVVVVTALSLGRWLRRSVVVGL